MLRDNMLDQARLISKRKSTTRTAGGYSRTPVIGPWFRCDYEEGSEDEQRSPGGIRRQRSGATLECPARALDGSAIEIDGTVQVEVDSVRFGTVVLDVVGTPEKLTQGRVAIGWRLQLQRINREAAA